MSRNLRRMLGAAIAMAGLLSACGEEVSRQPVPTVARFALTANETGALQIDECVVSYGVNSCSELPNPLGCENAQVNVREDGKPRGTCETEKETLKIVRFHDVGLFDCRPLEGEAKVECIDSLRKAFIADAKGLFRLVNASEVFGRYDLDPDGKAISGPDSKLATDEQCAQAARKAYADQLNVLLERAGLDLTYESAADDDYRKYMTANFGNRWSETNTRTRIVRFDWGGWCEEKAELPETWSTEKPRSEPDTPSKGPDEFGTWPEDGEEDEQLAVIREQIQRRLLSEVEGYCSVDNVSRWSRNNSEPGVAKVCRCAALASAALELEYCKPLSDSCDEGLWRLALYVEQMVATRWLTGQGREGLMVDSTEGKVPLVCRGSPLVLDLAGDGIDLSSLDEGVSFDLSGSGSVRTAWIRGGDDALLAMDRNGNGRIDDGRELFGEAPLSGVPMEDGFSALAALDQPESGGNGDGVVDARDVAFERLTLWTDTNRDGVSQPHELLSPSAAGIAALPLQSRRVGTILDAFGNDLSLRGSYVRTDGTRGSLVDVYFVTSKP